MKKIIAVIMTIILLSGCGITNTPTGKVKAFLNQYNSLSDEVLSDMDSKVANENLSVDNQKIYKDVLKRQYEDLKYEVKDEKIDGDKATVTVKLTVYDLYKVDKEAVNYMNTNPNEFNDELGVYSEGLFNKYRLNNMMSTNETVNYEVDFYLNKVNGQWILESPTKEVLEKIHGLYSYDVEY